MLPGIRITFCTYFKCIKQFQYKKETYDDYTAFCVKRGSFSYSIGNDNERVISGGEVVICPPKKSFNRKIINSIELCMIKFRLSDVVEFPQKSVKIPDTIRFSNNIEKLENCIFCADMEQHPVFEHYCKDILYMTDDAMINSPVLTNAQMHIQNNFVENIDVAQLAKCAGYSVAHFINTFKKIYGYTPKKYSSLLKLQKAKELLITTDKLSKEIAFLCGFNDELYFIRFFKKYTGMTPKEFKKQKI